METPDAVRDRLTAAVQAWMRHAGVSPTSLHKQTGISRDAFYRLQSGEGFPAIETLIAFAAVVGTTVDALLRGEAPTGEPTPPGRASAGSRSLAAEVAGMQQDLLVLMGALLPALQELADGRDAQSPVRQAVERLQALLPRGDGGAA